MKLEFSQCSFEKYSNIFHENPSSGSQVSPCIWMDRQTDMAKLVVVFDNFANMPKRGVYLQLSVKSLIF